MSWTEIGKSRSLTLAIPELDEMSVTVAWKTDDTGMVTRLTLESRGPAEERSLVRRNLQLVMHAFRNWWWKATGVWLGGVTKELAPGDRALALHGGAAWTTSMSWLEAARLNEWMDRLQLLWTEGVVEATW